MFVSISTILITPLIGVLLLLATPSFLRNSDSQKKIALITSLMTFVFSLFLWIGFDSSTSQFQFIEDLSMIPGLNICYSVGIDGISLLFVLLTTFLVPLCILASWNSIKDNIMEYLIAFLVLETCMISVFVVLDLLLFYVFFESVLIPMFLIIGIWGARERKIHAAFQFFFYTLLGSVFMLLGILLIYSTTGSTDYELLLSAEFSTNRQLLIWLSFFASFAVKVPMVPVHIWLPEAHVEAPTAGSVILAGILLKLGTYGFLRFSIPLFPEASVYFTPLIFVMSVVAIVYSSLTTLRQIDLKKIIAYSSVAHMNFVTIGLFTLTQEGIEGSILLMLSHGFISSALFLSVGVLYDRHHTRILRYYGGITQTMPIFSSIFLFLTLSNLSLPGTSSFIGEFLILLSALQSNTSICFLAATGTVLGAAYAIWLYNRVAFGTVQMKYINPYNDLTLREFAIFVPFIILILLMGIYPNVFLETMHLSVARSIINY